MIKRLLYLSCDNIYHVPGRRDTFASLSQARLSGWLISHDRKKCYCPECANSFAHVGRNGNLVNKSKKMLSNANTI